MKRNVKKIALKKHTLYLLNKKAAYDQQGGAAVQKPTYEKVCNENSLYPCSVTCPSWDTRCPACNGLAPQ